MDQSLHAGRSIVGFTLIELLVSVAIIAILASISVSVYSGAQSRARDGKRRIELDAIAKALETNKTDAGYQPLAGAQFQSGSIPTTDPSGNAYCIAYSAGTGVPASWAGTACPSSFVQISSATPNVNTAAWQLCTTGEVMGVVCRSSIQ